MNLFESSIPSGESLLLWRSFLKTSHQQLEKLTLLAFAGESLAMRKQQALRVSCILIVLTSLLSTLRADDLPSASTLRRRRLQGSAKAVDVQQRDTEEDDRNVHALETQDDVILSPHRRVFPWKSLMSKEFGNIPRLFALPTTHSRHLSKSSSFQSEWRQLDPDERMLALLGLILAFLVCWCVMSCICNCLRACFCGGRPQRRREYRQIDGRTVVYRDSYYNGGGDRPCMNLLWGACCFECCCRDNQDVDCCQLCCPLLLMECCCPP